MGISKLNAYFVPINRGKESDESPIAISYYDKIYKINFSLLNDQSSRRTVRGQDF